MTQNMSSKIICAVLSMKNCVDWCIAATRNFLKEGSLKIMEDRRDINGG